MLFVANGYYQQETDIYNHMQDLGMFDVTIKKDYQIYGSTDLNAYDIIIITGFAPNIGYSATNNIKNSGIPLMIIEYWDFWYSYKMGLLNWDSGDYYGTDTVELIDDQHPITIGLDQEVEVYDEPWAVLYGASLSSLSSDTEPLIYSWPSANEAAVIVDDDRKIVATGIYDTTHYTDGAWEIFDQILGYLHPAGGASGIIAPDGYTTLEFIDMIQTKLEDVELLEVNGIEYGAIHLDEPLVYYGPVPKMQFVALTESEMNELEVSPGDETPNSTSFNRKFYILDTEDEVADLGDNDGTDPTDEFVPLSLQYGLGTLYNGDFYNINGGAPGSGLVYGKDTYFEIYGAAELPSRCDNPDIPGWCWYGTGFAKADFGQFQMVFDVPNPGIVGKHKTTTHYAKYTPFTVPIPGQSGVEVFIWLVWEGPKWLQYGEDIWDDIDVKISDADYPFEIENIRVVHNSMEVLNDSVDISVDEGDYRTRSLQYGLLSYKEDLIFGINNPVLSAAVSNFAQGAHGDYRAGEKNLIKKDVASPNVPVAWCTEFASWAIWAGYGFMDLESGGTNPFPQADPFTSGGDPDISTGDFRDWLSNTPSGPSGTNSRFVFFGDDAAQGIPSMNNYRRGGGVWGDEWNCLGGIDPGFGYTCESMGFHVIDAGDYVGKQQCKGGSSCLTNSGHSMIVIGWADVDFVSYIGDDPNQPEYAAIPVDVGSDHFVKNRNYNWIAVIEGNANPDLDENANDDGGSPIPGMGLTRVAINAKLVCPFFDSQHISSMNNENLREIDVNGDGIITYGWGETPSGPNERFFCDIRLWDTHYGNAGSGVGDSEGAFFGDFYWTNAPPV